MEAVITYESHTYIKEISEGERKGEGCDCSASLQGEEAAGHPDLRVHLYGHEHDGVNTQVDIMTNFNSTRSPPN